jgi:hypothetical protein
MTDPRPTCVVCQANSDQVPLISFEYQGQPYAICPQHLPVLIHEPTKLTGKLPGAESLSGHKH